MNLTALNDWHIGAVRSAGTTPQTAWELRQHLLGEFEDCLYGVKTDLLINGDLLDSADINKADLLRTFQVLSDWLVRTGQRLYLSNGNHDLSKSSLNYSSFQFLAALLVDQFGPQRVTHITKGSTFVDPETLAPIFHIIPHVANQDIFDMELAKVPAVDYLFVHANYDNGFAVESDHALNLSRAQAEKCLAKTIVFGHEHQARTELGGKVVIVGNQIPSSISDCLGNDEKSFFQTVDDTYHMPVTWNAEGDYSEQDWHDLKDTGRFIRVVGSATAAESAAVMTAISRFRQTAKALVITNAVKIEGVADAGELQLSHEAVTSFNVHAALSKLLTEDENVKINKLLNPQKEA